VVTVNTAFAVDPDELLLPPQPASKPVATNATVAAVAKARQRLIDITHTLFRLDSSDLTVTTRLADEAKSNHYTG
jgi:hypothetical protein